jgi:hypothetical protein
MCCSCRLLGSLVSFVMVEVEIGERLAYSLFLSFLLSLFFFLDEVHSRRWGGDLRNDLRRIGKREAGEEEVKKRREEKKEKKRKEKG